MNRLLVMGCAFCAVLSAFAGTRTVSVAVKDAESSTLTLTFGGDAEKKWLFAAHDASDKGEVPSAWAEQRFVTTVLPATASLDWRVPQTWRNGAIRFFFADVDPNLGYDHKIEGVYKNVNNKDVYFETGLTAGPDSTAECVFWCNDTAGSPERGLFGTVAYFGAFTQSGRTFLWDPCVDTNVASYVIAPHGSTWASGKTYRTIKIGGGILFDGTVPYLKKTNTENQYTGGFPLVRETVSKTTTKLFVIANETEVYQYNKNGGYFAIRSFKMTTGGQTVADYQAVSKDGTPGFWDSVSSTRKMATGAWGFETKPALPDWRQLADAEAQNSILFAVPEGLGGIGFTAAFVPDTFNVKIDTEKASSVKRYVYLAKDKTDKGTDPAAWKDLLPAGILAASSSTVTVAVPEHWRHEEAALRVFLVAADEDEDPTLTFYDSIQKTGGSGYVDTGYVPDEKTLVEFDFKHTDTSGTENSYFGISGICGLFTQGARCFVYLSQLNTNMASCAMAVNYGSQWNNYINNSSPHDGFEGDRHLMKLGQGGVFSVDGYRPTLYCDGSGAGYAYGADYNGGYTNAQPRTTTRTMTVFTLRKIDSGDSKYAATGLIAYRFNVYSDGVPVRQMVPARKDSSNGMYDVVEKVFHAYSDSGSSLGNQTAAPYDARMARSSVPLAMNRTVALVSADKTAGSVELAFAGAPLRSYLFAAYDRVGDHGVTADGWPSTVCLGRVESNAVSKTVTDLPRQWWTHGGAVRFFLQGAGDEPFAKRLEYVENSDENGGQYINIGVKPNPTCEVKIKARHRIGDISSFGCSDWFAFIHSGGNCYNAINGVTHYYANPYYFTHYLGTSYADIPPYEMEMSRDGLKVTGDAKTAAFDVPNEDVSKYRMILFGRINASGGREKYKTRMSIYSFTMKMFGEPQFDLVPCQRDNGAVTFYNRVTRKFMPVWGSGAFVAGPDALPALADAPILSVTDALEFAPSGTMVIFR